jgi:hypothetical protein
LKERLNRKRNLINRLFNVSAEGRILSLISAILSLTPVPSPKERGETLFLKYIKNIIEHISLIIWEQAPFSSRRTCPTTGGRVGDEALLGEGNGSEALKLKDWR